MAERRKWVRGLFAMTAVVCSLVGTAQAAPPVQVFGTWARGEMGTAHNTAGSQYVGCWVSTDSAGTSMMYCEANDGVGSMNFCVTTNPAMMNTAQTVQTSSELQFGWDSGHGCTWFVVQNFSQPPGRKS